MVTRTYGKEEDMEPDPGQQECSPFSSTLNLKAVYSLAMLVSIHKITCVRTQKTTLWAVSTVKTLECNTI
jgi:hypothetical protein